MKKLCAVLVLVVLSAACGGNGTGIDDGNVSGSWSGSYGGPLVGNGTATLALVQTGTTLSGTWTTSGAGGTSSGTVSGTNSARGDSGTFVIDLNPGNPNECPFRSTMAFTKTTMTGNWVTFDCTVSTSGTLSLTRR